MLNLLIADDDVDGFFFVFLSNRAAKIKKEEHKQVSTIHTFK
jgi:hypothetical protein